MANDWFSGAGPFSSGSSQQQQSYNPLGGSSMSILNQPWYRSFANQYFNTTPAAGLGSFLGGSGLSPLSPYGSFIGNRLGDIYSGYLGEATSRNPNLDFVDYLQQQQPYFRNLWAQEQAQGRPIAPRRIL